MKGIIFDIDGTLLDSLGAWSDSDRIFLESYGIVYDPMVSSELKTMHFSSAAEYLVKKYSLPMTGEEAGEKIFEIIKEQYFHEIKLKPYVREYMEKCNDENIPMCAATSNIKSLAVGALQNRKILGFLQFILSADDVSSGKDSPEIFLKCAEKLGLMPYDITVFEDSPHAAITAKSAGFYVIGIKNPHEVSELENICDRVISSFSELI